MLGVDGFEVVLMIVVAFRGRLCGFVMFGDGFCGLLIGALALNFLLSGLRFLILGLIFDFGSRLKRKLMRLALVPAKKKEDGADCIVRKIFFPNKNFYQKKYLPQYMAKQNQLPKISQMMVVNKTEEPLLVFIKKIKCQSSKEKWWIKKRAKECKPK